MDCKLQYDYKSRGLTVVLWVIVADPHGPLRVQAHASGLQDGGGTVGALDAGQRFSVVRDH